MARRRMISEELLVDERFNALTIEAQNLFLRMLAKSDDCGVVPANPYTLAALVNPPEKIRKNLQRYLDEIVSGDLGGIIEYDGKVFFAFKTRSFLEHQGHILNKRKRSEYLKITAKEYDSGNFQESTGKSSSRAKNESSVVESRKQKVESSKQKVESRKHGEFVPPKVEEVVEYFREHGFPESLARRAFEHYSVANWQDSRGQPVKNWKQKMISVWFNEENRNGTGHRAASSQGGGGGRETFTDDTIRRLVKYPAESAES